MKGPVPVERLGVTLMHEHLFTGSTDVIANYPQTFERERLYSRVLERLAAAKAAGVSTVVDLTVMGLGRDIRDIQAVASMADINVVVATGCYNRGGMPPPFFMYQPAPDAEPSPVLPPEIPDPLVDLFVSDIEVGIAGTGIKAAVLKCLTDAEGMTPGNERVLRAVAKAHLATGVPISTHSHAGTKTGLQQQRVFREEGVDPSKVVIGHAGDSTDMAYLEQLIAGGSYLGMDRFGYEHVLPLAARISIVAELCRRGHSSRLVLSHDAVCSGWFADPRDLWTRLPAARVSLLFDEVLPALRDHKVTEEQLDEMLVQNPKKIFGGRQ